MAEDADLPKALVKRIVKAKLITLQPQADSDEKREVQLNKDALLAFAESSKIFIAYVTATANDICKQAKRQIISGEDVATALEELDFEAFVGPIRQSLESFKKGNKEKNKRKAEQLKKRKEEKAQQTHEPAQDGTDDNDKRFRLDSNNQQHAEQIFPPHDSNHLSQRDQLVPLHAAPDDSVSIPM